MVIETWKSLQHMHMCGTGVLDMGMRICICVSFMPSNPKWLWVVRKRFFKNWQYNTIQRTLIFRANMIQTKMSNTINSDHIKETSEILIRTELLAEKKLQINLIRRNNTFAHHFRDNLTKSSMHTFWAKWKFRLIVYVVDTWNSVAQVCMCIECGVVLQRNVKIHFVRIGIVKEVKAATWLK